MYMRKGGLMAAVFQDGVQGGHHNSHWKLRVLVLGMYRDWVWRLRFGVALRTSTLLRLEHTTSVTKLVQSLQTSFRIQPWA